MKNRLLIVLALAALIASSLACAARKYVSDTRVYASTSGGVADDFYNSTSKQILQDGVWVFQPDGTFTARLTVDGAPLSLAGKYQGDDSGKDFLIHLDTNSDGAFEDSLYMNQDDTSFEWRRPSGTLTFYLAPVPIPTEES